MRAVLICMCVCVMTNFCHCLCAAAGAASKYKKRNRSISSSFRVFVPLFYVFFGDCTLDVQFFVGAIICIINVVVENKEK